MACQTFKATLHQWSKSNMTTLSWGPSRLYKTAKDGSEEPVIPSPHLFNFDRETGFIDSQHLRNSTEEYRLPTVAECATHLELLQVFYVLRQRILSSEGIDTAMGITPKREEKTGRQGDTKTLKDPKLWDKRQVKWPKFLEFAAVRFLTWMDILAEEKDSYICTDEKGRAILLILPPLDVLMVWHSFMLNPRLYNQTCKDHPIYKLRMPWNLVHRSIDSKQWSFQEDEKAAMLFRSFSSVESDLFEELSHWKPGEDSHSASHTNILTEFDLGQPQNTGSGELPGTNSLWPQRYIAMSRKIDSSLAIQLKDAVIRQAEFVDKMNNHLWIRSPAVEGTLRRAINRYDKFLTILGMPSGVTIVPTLDIDLAWHTHQCSPALYAKGTKAMVGRFINHDDTIVKEKLGDGFDFSRKMYRVRFGQEYQICGCWDCEALLSGVEAAAELDESEVDMQKVAYDASKRVMYYRAVEVALRKKQALPVPDW